jgi:hypothetical protein
MGVARDHRESRRATAICYVNVFQTQPEQRRCGVPVIPTCCLASRPAVTTRDGGEVLLTRTPERRRALARIVGADRRLPRADVEPDNLDSWTRSSDCCGA